MKASVLCTNRKLHYALYACKTHPLGEKLNNELKDKSFLQKIKRYPESNYATVKKFMESIKSIRTWGEEEIENRTKEIADILYNKMWKI